MVLCHDSTPLLQLTFHSTFSLLTILCSAFWGTAQPHLECLIFPSLMFDPTLAMFTVVNNSTWDLE